MVGSFRCYLWNQLVPEGYDVLLRDFSDRVVRTQPEELDEFSETLAIEGHRRGCGCGFFRLEPASHIRQRASAPSYGSFLWSRSDAAVRCDHGNRR